MKDSMIEGLVGIILSELEIYLKKRYGANYNVSVANDQQSLSTEDFIVSYYQPEKKFFVSFKVGLYGKEVASYTKDILAILAPEEFDVLEDCFYDKDDRSMKYGLEAIDAKKKSVFRQSGYEKCPICEKPHKKENITEIGICKFCNLTTIVWH